MTGTMVHITEAPSTTTADEVTAAAIAATRATTFLRAQAQWLQRGLTHADDAVAVGIVLGSHDRSHDRWVGVIDLVGRTLGTEVGQHVATLYAYFGRVAGSLERGTMDLLSPEVAASARQLLGHRLTDLTEHAVDALWRAAAEV